MRHSLGLLVVPLCSPLSERFQSYQHENDLDSKFFLGSFTYDAGGDALQMFAMQHVDPKGTPVIELETLNNYGAPVTCLYRFRVHGNMTQTQP